MNAYLPSSAVELWHIAGSTMIHYLWLGTLIAAVALVCRLLSRRAAPNVRYAIVLACLILVAAAPLAIAAWLIANSDAMVDGGRLFVVAPGHPEANAAIVELHGGEATRNSEPPPESTPLVELDRAPAAATSPEPIPAVRTKHGIQPLAVFAVQSAVSYLPWLWLIGTPLTFTLLAAGLVGTNRLRRASRTIESGAIREIFVQLAESLRITTRVTIAVCDRIAAPVLVGIVRPMILLPPAALTGWSPDEIEMVLLHELAHVRRWDNLINLLQRITESLLFFHPAVWLISNWVRREREACCDAIVVARTHRPHAYAELLVALAAQIPRSVLFHPAASSAMATGPLRSRIRRILELEDDPMLISGKSFTVMLATFLTAATLAVLYLPTIGQAEESATKNPESTESSGTTIQVESAGISKGPTTAEFPFTVQFEEGASRFLEGDTIKVLEVRGTAETFEPGNIYWIKGTYTLGSHDRAQLLADTTAKEAADGTGVPTWNVQTAVVDRGKGTFALFLPMSYRGWPHVSFYPADGGEGFGGSYFGTGDSVAKKWLGGELHESVVETTTIAPASARASRFPSLEEQKLADLAWKRLGLEMESIGDEDLKRVQALGYEGGLKVASGAAGMGSGGNIIETGDILVGLHVWPTTSIKALAEVLNRDDLAELNPLKFYAIHVEMVGGTPDNPIMADVVRTGRVSVNLSSGFGDAQQMMQMMHAQARGRLGLVPVATPAKPQAPADAPAAVDKSSLRYDGKTFDEWRTAWQTELSTEKWLEAVKALAAFGRAGYGNEAAEAILDVAGDYDFSVIANDVEGMLKTAVLDALAPRDRAQSLAVYWVPDLAERLQKEPKKWSMLASNLFSRLTTQDEQVLTTVQSLANADEADVRFQALAALVRASQSRSGGPRIDEKTRDALARALGSKEPQLARSTLGLLLYYPPFASGRGAMGGGMFGGGGMAGGFGEMATPQPRLMYQPELVSLLFHPDETVRREARGVLRHIDEKDAPQVVQQLIAVLQDESRKADHIHAIRGLAAISPHADEAVPILQQLLKRGREENRDVVAAAAFALSAMDPGKYDPELTAGWTDEENRELEENVNREQEILFPAEDQNQGGGGGFF